MIRLPDFHRVSNFCDQKQTDPAARVYHGRVGAS